MNRLVTYLPSGRLGHEPCEEELERGGGDDEELHDAPARRHGLDAEVADEVRQQDAQRDLQQSGGGGGAGGTEGESEGSAAVVEEEEAGSERLCVNSDPVWAERG